MPLLALKVSQCEHSDADKVTVRTAQSILCNYLYTKLAILPIFYVLLTIEISITIVTSSSPRCRDQYYHRDE